MPVGNQHTWRLASRKIGDKKWMVSTTPMTASHARSVARQLDHVYPDWEHQAVRAEDYEK